MLPRERHALGLLSALANIHKRGRCGTRKSLLVSWQGHSFWPSRAVHAVLHSGLSCVELLKRSRVHRVSCEGSIGIKAMIRSMTGLYFVRNRTKLVPHYGGHFQTQNELNIYSETWAERTGLWVILDGGVCTGQNRLERLSGSHPDGIKAVENSEKKGSFCRAEESISEEERRSGRRMTIALLVRVVLRRRTLLAEPKTRHEVETTTRQRN